MSWRHVVPVLVVGSLAASGAHAHEWGGGVGRLLDVSVEIEGGSAPLYASPDGSGRFYFEAREGRRYAIRLANRTGERLGAVLTRRRPQRDQRPARRRPRAHVRDRPLGGDDRPRLALLARRRPPLHVRGRAGELRRPLRQGQRRMGWIEVAVYLERRRWVYPHPLPRPYDPSVRDKAEGERDDSADSVGRSGEAPAAKAPSLSRAGSGSGRASVSRPRGPGPSRARAGAARRTIPPCS